MTLARALYTACMVLLQPVYAVRLRWRARREPGYGQYVSQRWGRYAQPAAAQAYFWIHTVSLGETRAIAPLIAALRQRWPELRLLLTHSTATGRAAGLAYLQAGDEQAWLPWDTPGNVRRFLRHFQPRIGLLMETEVWPNLVAICRSEGVPLWLINARLSEKSLRKSQRLAALAKSAFSQLGAVYAQTEADAQRLRQLGAPVQGVMGNLKFDVLLNADQQNLAHAWRAGFSRPVVMLASAREGEVQMLLQQLQALSPEQVRSVQWLIVPRHPQRFDEAAQCVRDAGWILSRRSQWASAGPQLQADIWLGDSLGEMPLYYSLSDVALLGGSFAPFGGQNLIEALDYGCPVIMGPHTYNFAAAAEQSVQAGAAFSVPDLPQAIALALALTHAPQRLTAARQAGHAWMQTQRGAVARLMHALQRVIKE